MMEEENQYPPRFEVEVSGSQARESVNALISFKGLADDNGNNTTELLLEKATFSNGIYLSNRMRNYARPVRILIANFSKHICSQNDH